MIISLYQYHLDYADSGFINRNKQISFASTHRCLHCQEEKGMGFIINASSDFVAMSLGFVCLSCSFNFLQLHGYEIKSPKDISLINLDLPKRYGMIYSRYMRGKLLDDSFKILRNEYSKYVHEDLMNIVEHLGELDLEYNKNSSKGTEWEGYWQGLTGEEQKTFFALLETSIEHNTNPIYIFDNEYRIPNSLNFAVMIYEKYCS